MGIYLDWDVESDEGNQQIGEDPRVLAERKRRARRLKLGVAAGLILLIIGGIVAGVRITQVAHWRREMLTATVEAEMLALRIGDRREFLQGQMNEDAWRAVQRRTFDEFQAIAPRVQMPGEILEMEITRYEARVEVREIIDGEDAVGVWMYEYTDKGWRHVESPAEPWGRQYQISSMGTEFVFFGLDSELAAEVQQLFNEWYVAGTVMTGSDHFPVSQVKIEPSQEAQLGWEDRQRSILIIPSERPDGTPITTLDSVTRQQIALMVAEAWTQALLGSEPRVGGWVRDETLAALRHEFDPLSPPSAILGPLSEAFGSDLMPLFVAQIRDRHPAAQSLRFAMTAAAPPDLSGEALEQYTLNYVKAAIAFQQQSAVGSYGNLDTATQMAFYDWESDQAGQYPVYSYAYLNPTADLETIEVLGVQQFGEVLWAEMQFTSRSMIVDGGRTDLVELRMYVPFRMVDGCWVMATSMQDADWGAYGEAQGQYVTLGYHALDDALVATLLSDLDRVYAQTAADFGLAEPPRILLQVRPTLFHNLPPTAGDEPRTIQPIIASPHLSACGASTTWRDCVYYQAVNQISLEVLAYQLGKPANSYYYFYYPETPVERGLLYWELQRNGSDWDHGLAEGLGSGDRAVAHVPTGLAELWPQPLYYSNDAATDHAWIMALEVLYDVLEDQYGIEAIHALIRTLPEVGSIEDWLTQSLDLSIAEIEPLWRERYQQRLWEAGYPVQITGG